MKHIIIYIYICILYIHINIQVPVSWVTLQYEAGNKCSSPTQMLLKLVRDIMAHYANAVLIVVPCSK